MALPASFSLFSLLFLSFSLFTSAQNQQNSSTPKSCPPLAVRQVYQFQDKSVWIENVASRRNGDLILTQAGPQASIYLLENSTSSSPKVTLLQNFTGHNVLLGIAEPRPDVFVVAAGNLTSRRQPVNGSWSVYEMAFQGQTNKAAVRKVVDIPQAKFLNGAAALNADASGSVVLVGDSLLGAVWKVDIAKNTAEKAIENVPEMKPSSNGDPPFGINGMKIRNGTLWFDNSDDRSFYQMNVTSLMDGQKKSGGDAATPAAKKVGSAAQATTFVDDFDIGPDGVIWASSSSGSDLLVIDPKNAQTFLAASKGNMTLGGATAAVFGRGKSDRNVLYVVTNREQNLPANSTEKESGMVLAVDTSQFSDCKSGTSSSAARSVRRAVGGVV